MTEIGFYHLTRTPLDRALPKLLGRVLGQQGRALVLCADEERVRALDAALWTCQDPDWLPHGTKAAGHAAMQPIWLTTEDAPAPNGARFLFMVDGMESAHLADYDRVLDLFDGGGRSGRRRRARPLARGQGRWARPRLLEAGPARLGEGRVNGAILACLPACFAGSA